MKTRQNKRLSPHYAIRLSDVDDGMVAKYPSLREVVMADAAPKKPKAI
jgi:hypothetical protein